MRTTVNIDDELLFTLKSMARSKSMSLGRVLSELIKKGLQQGYSFKTKNSFPTFSVPQDAQVITPEHVKLDEDE